MGLLMLPFGVFFAFSLVLEQESSIFFEADLRGGVLSRTTIAFFSFFCFLETKSSSSDEEEKDKTSVGEVLDRFDELEGVVELAEEFLLAEPSFFLAILQRCVFFTLRPPPLGETASKSESDEYHVAAFAGTEAGADLVLLPWQRRLSSESESDAAGPVNVDREMPIADFLPRRLLRPIVVEAEAPIQREPDRSIGTTWLPVLLRRIGPSEAVAGSRPRPHLFITSMGAKPSALALAWSLAMFRSTMSPTRRTSLARPADAPDPAAPWALTSLKSSMAR